MSRPPSAADLEAAKVAAGQVFAACADVLAPDAEQRVADYVQQARLLAATFHDPEDPDFPYGQLAEQARSGDRLAAAALKRLRKMSGDETTPTKRGPAPELKRVRDEAIAAAILAAVRAGGIKPTRGLEQRRTPCGASIVHRLCCESRLNLSEDAVVKIWKRLGHLSQVEHILDAVNMARFWQERRPK